MCMLCQWQCVCVLLCVEARVVCLQATAWLDPCNDHNTGFCRPPWRACITVNWQQYYRTGQQVCICLSLCAVGGWCYTNYTIGLDFKMSVTRGTASILHMIITIQVPPLPPPPKMRYLNMIIAIQVPPPPPPPPPPQKKKK